MVREAIEGHIGMLTCQVIDLNVRLQAAQNEMGRMVAALQDKDTEIEQLRKLIAPGEAAAS
jgi:hypothetical protein